jgi:hypothetical protein
MRSLHVNINRHTARPTAVRTETNNRLPATANAGRTVLLLPLLLLKLLLLLLLLLPPLSLALPRVHLCAAEEGGWEDSAKEGLGRTVSLLQQRRPRMMAMTTTTRR